MKLHLECTVEPSSTVNTVWALKTVGQQLLGYNCVNQTSLMHSLFCWETQLKRLASHPATIYGLPNFISIHKPKNTEPLGENKTVLPFILVDEIKTERLSAFGSQDVRRELKGRSPLQVTVQRHHAVFWALHTSKIDVFPQSEYFSPRTNLTDGIWTREFIMRPHTSTKHPSHPCALRVSQDPLRKLSNSESLRLTKKALQLQQGNAKSPFAVLKV